MARQIDGWALLARIAAHRDHFFACEQTAALAGALLLRNQLVRGVASEEQFLALSQTVGLEVMQEVIRDLAGYEAMRVLRNLHGGERPLERLSPELARRRLAELAAQTTPASAAALIAEPAPEAPTRTLRRHRSLGARRLRAPAELATEHNDG